MRVITSATVTGPGSTPGSKRLLVGGRVRPTHRWVRLAFGERDVPRVNGPGMTITVSMPSGATSYRMAWAITSNAASEATYGPRKGARR